jgi:hypothetical protein
MATVTKQMQTSLLNYFQQVLYKTMETKIENNKIKVRFTSTPEIIPEANYHRITMHFTNEEEAKTFLEMLTEVLKKVNIKSLATIQTLKMKRSKPSFNDYFERCDWSRMPEFTIDEELANCPSFELYLEKGDKEAPFCKELKKRTGLTFSDKSKYKWYPSRPVPASKLHYYVFEEEFVPKYPIYVISKGRWDKRHTSRYLEWSKIDYKIVIEQSEYENYAAVIDPAKIIVMPDEFKQEQIKIGNGGGIPVRNFVMRHSKERGDIRHWILDDNIATYKRMQNSDRVIIKGGGAFRIVEDFTDRYENILLSGHNYTMFCISTNTRFRPLTKNTRIYSSILIHNSIPFEWRGVYNEDVDLSIRVLKAGYPTILFNSILADKICTMATKGGNTSTIYADEDYAKRKVKSLISQHPDIVKLTTAKFDRDHHQVNYEGFKSLIFKLKEGEVLVDETYDYGMVLKLRSDLPFFK